MREGDADGKPTRPPAGYLAVRTEQPQPGIGTVGSRLDGLGGVEAAGKPLEVLATP
jgi:hypothetical protein